MDPVTGKIRRMTDFIDVLIDVGMVLFILNFWLNPAPADASDINTFGVLMGFEFIMVHSGAMMLFISAMFSPWIALCVFFPVYGLFAWGFNMAADNNAVMWVYLAVVFWRMRFAFSRPEYLVAMRAFKSAFFKAFVYFGALVVSVFCESLFPYFGLTPAFAAEHGLGAGGTFFSTPNAVMGFGVIYYAGLAAFDFWLAKDTARLATPFE